MIKSCFCLPVLYYSRFDACQVYIYKVSSNICLFTGADEYQYKSIAWQDDAIDIINDNICSFEVDGASQHRQRCTYYIGVYAYSACSFSVLANFQNRISLEDGVPLAVTDAKHGEGRRFSFLPQVDADDDLSISLIVER